MSEFQEQMEDLKKLINNLTSQILDAIENDRYSIAGELITKRLDHLSQLVSSVKTEQDKQVMLRYLTDFQKNDQLIAERLNKERDIIRTTLVNIENVKKYTVL